MKAIECSYGSCCTHATCAEEGLVTGCSNAIIISCIKCKKYKSIDSGYGECRNGPPSISYNQKLSFWRSMKILKYPIVPWCFSGCYAFEEEKT